ncbi:MAG: hypothetical protein ACP5UU_06320 [Thermoprotei archaeon]
MVPKSSNHWGKSAGNGDKHSPKRHWRSYNEELVVRGEFLLDIGAFKRWERELKRANGKREEGHILPALFHQVAGAMAKAIIAG